MTTTAPCLVLLGVPRSPAQIQAVTFRLTSIGRRGYRRAEVHRYLDEIADDLAAVREDLAGVRTENERLKAHLREWQTRNSPARFLRGRP